MRIALAAAIAALVALPGAASAQTYGDNYPVCLQVYGPITYSDCRYTSIDQCQFSASGRPAQCMANPYFVAGSPPPRRRRHR